MLSKNKIKYIKQLQQKKHRESEKKFFAEGNKICEEAIKFHPDLVEEIICTNNWASEKNILNDIKTNVADYDDIKKLSSLSNPQESMVILKSIENDIDTIKEVDDIILVLDNISDPGNLGTIIRLADWFGIEHIVCSNNTVDCYNPKVVQATMGAILRVKIYYTHLNKFFENFSTQNISIYGTTLQGDNIYHTTLKKPCILIMGNESEGINETLLKYLNKELYIPNFSSRKEKSESLNVSTATAITLSELRRS